MIKGSFGEELSVALHGRLQPYGTDPDRIGHLSSDQAQSLYVSYTGILPVSYMAVGAMPLAAQGEVGTLEGWLASAT